MIFARLSSKQDIVLLAHNNIGYLLLDSRLSLLRDDHDRETGFLSRSFLQLNGIVKLQARTCSLMSGPNGDRPSGASVSGILDSTFKFRRYRSIPFLRDVPFKRNVSKCCLWLTKQSSLHCRCTTPAADRRVPLRNEHRDREYALASTGYLKHHRREPKITFDERLVCCSRTSVRFHCGLLIASQNWIARCTRVSMCRTILDWIHAAKSFSFCSSALVEPKRLECVEWKMLDTRKADSRPCRMSSFSIIRWVCVNIPPKLNEQSFIFDE